MIDVNTLSIRSLCRVTIETQKKLFASVAWQQMSEYERGIYMGRCLLAQDILEKIERVEVRDATKN